MDLGFRDAYIEVLGHRLYSESVGAPTGGTLLFLHGSSVDHRVGLYPADLVQFGYRVVLFDRLGVGRSQRPRSYRGFGIARDAEEVEAVRRKLRLGRCHLMGYSYGGNVALETILRYPRSFRGAIVASGSASRPQFERELHRIVARLPPGMSDAFAKVEVEGKPPGKEYADPTAAFNRRQMSDQRVIPHHVQIAFGGGNPTVEAANDAANRAWDVRARLPGIRLPTLVTVGTRDLCTPRLARTISRAIPGARLVVFKRSAHDVPDRERDLFVETLRTFLEEHEGTAA